MQEKFRCRNCHQLVEAETGHGNVFRSHDVSTPVRIEFRLNCPSCKQPTLYVRAATPEEDRASEEAWANRAAAGPAPPGATTPPSKDRNYDMPATIQAKNVPLRDDSCGGFRVGASRVPLDVVIHEHQGGASAEDIVAAYPALRLTDVRAVIAYYLANKDEVDAHLRQREAEADALRREIENRQPDRAALRAKLLARRQR